MSIETMTFVNVVGKLECLEDFLLKLVKFKMFHIEEVKKNINNYEYKPLTEKNPYSDMLNKVVKTLNLLNISTDLPDYEKFKIEKNAANTENFEKFVNEVHCEICEYEKNINVVKAKISALQKNLKLVEHIKNTDINIKELLHSKHLDVHFGTIPINKIDKLEYIKNENFYFIPQDKDCEFCWGFYVAPKAQQQRAFEFFNELLFKEYIFQEGLDGNSSLAINNIKVQIEDLKKNLGFLYNKTRNYKTIYFKKLILAYVYFKVLSDTFNLRQFAIVKNNKFNMCGFVPNKMLKEFNNIFKGEEGVVFEFLNKNKVTEYSPPVKLKTCRFFRPFEEYVKIYGIPQYETINPSSFIGLIYSLVFGVMFGDLGQGFLLLIGGFLIWKAKKNTLGLILTRCGVFSMLFGFIFDSIFGFEGILERLWILKRITGYKFPFHLLEPKNSLTILVFSCFLGMLLILTSIGINIYLNIKNKDIGEAVFSHNGLAGFILYGGFIIFALCLMILKINIMSITFLIVVVGVPMSLIFFSIPLKNLANSKKTIEKFTVSSAFFDMVDIILSYFANTLSFLRVGGLALSHAALMLVVMKFAGMVESVGGFGGAVGKPMVIVLGNVFVVFLEGLIVSIQSLRLIYYEIFSRFYRANGKPFKPAKISFEK